MRAVFRRLFPLMVISLLAAGCQSMGKAPHSGHFKAESFRQTLIDAASRVEEDLDISAMLSEAAITPEAATIKFSPPSYPEGLSYSLAPLKSDHSSDTLIMRMVLDKEKAMPDGYLAAACALILLEAVDPGSSGDKWGQLEEITQSGGETVINGWTYKCSREEGARFSAIIFTASAPAWP